MDDANESKSGSYSEKGYVGEGLGDEEAEEM